MEFCQDDFEKKDFSGQEIDGTEYNESTFNDCNFSGAILKNCTFTDCRFIRCNLSNISIYYSKFSGVSFENSKVIGVDWTRAFWADFQLDVPLKFKGCNISDSSFFGLDLKEIVISDCKASDVDFRDGNFANGDFSYSDLSNSIFGNTDLTKANFENALNFNINIYNNKIKGAKFSRIEAVRLLDSLDIELL